MYYSEDGIIYDEIYIKALDSMPIGSVIGFVGTDIPNGWLECDGSTITQSDYPELYALIGGTLPDFRGKVLVGQDTNDTDFDTLGETGGSKELQAHNHGGATGGNYAYDTTAIYTTGGSTNFYILNWNGSKVGNDGAFQSKTYHAHEIPTDGTGNSGNLQPYAVVKHIIKAKNTTPTMASVVNVKNDSTEDAYSCDYINNKYEGTILYYDDNGTSGNVPLSDNVSNYRYLEIYYMGAHNWGYSSMKIDLSLSDKISLISFSSSSNDPTAYFAGVIYSANGNTLSFVSSKVFRTDEGTNTGNIITIHKVIGYK